MLPELIIVFLLALPARHLSHSNIKSTSLTHLLTQSLTHSLTQSRFTQLHSLTHFPAWSGEACWSRGQAGATQQAAQAEVGPL